jgi:DNA-binding transcriptional MocR family regulator
MYEPSGYVKLYRTLLWWQWYQNPNVFRLYIHILLKASFKDFNFEGKFYKAGSVITSRKKLSEELGISEWQVLTAIEKLRSTGEISVTTTNKFTVIYVNNWVKTQQEHYCFENKSSHPKKAKNPNNSNCKTGGVGKEKNPKENSSIDWALMDKIINRQN